MPKSQQTQTRSLSEKQAQRKIRGLFNLDKDFMPVIKQSFKEVRELFELFESPAWGKISKVVQIKVQIMQKMLGNVFGSQEDVYRHQHNLGKLEGLRIFENLKRDIHNLYWELKSYLENE